MDKLIHLTEEAFEGGHLFKELETLNTVLGTFIGTINLCGDGKHPVIHNQMYRDLDAGQAALSCLVNLLKQSTESTVNQADLTSIKNKLVIGFNESGSQSEFNVIIEKIFKDYEFRKKEKDRDLPF